MRRKGSFGLGMCVPLLLALGCPGGGAGRADPNPTAREIPPPRDEQAELEAAIVRTGDYLERLCRESGRFDYRFDLNPKVKLKPQYNMLRHAGAIYALCDYQRWRGKRGLTPTLTRAHRFLLQEIGPVPGEEGPLAVWSRPELAGAKAPLQAKLGGAGLGLVALCSLEALQEGTTPAATLAGLGRFVLFMQKSDGSFHSKFIPSEGGRSEKWTSLYYPGEAALGLVMLHELDGNRAWLDGAARALGYLARIRRGKERTEADHWALLATARLLPHLEKLETPPAAPQDLVAHAQQICTSILAEQNTEGSLVMAGGFTEDGRTTPTATRLEGLLAAYTCLPPGPRRDELLPAIRAGARFLLQAYVRDGPQAGAMPRAISALPGADRKFNRRATEIRIDYMQHALSAWIQLHERLYSKR